MVTATVKHQKIANIPQRIPKMARIDLNAYFLKKNVVKSCIRL